MSSSKSDSILTLLAALLVLCACAAVCAPDWSVCWFSAFIFSLALVIKVSYVLI